ncbi:MAG: hypothetical protein PVJ02_06355 [Gemmatimonadota bacterium]
MGTPLAIRQRANHVRRPACPPRFPSARALIPLVVLSAAFSTACHRFTNEPFPPRVRPGVQVTLSQDRVWAAVVEFVNVRGVGVARVDSLSATHAVTTDWFDMSSIQSPDGPVATCPSTSEGPPRAYRGRYRFTVGARTIHSFLTVEAHWQAERLEGLDGTPAWVDCTSTGTWEKRTVDWLVLRAREIRPGLVG